MRKSTFISAALHTAILLFALVAFPAAKMDHTPLVAIPVDLATPSELTKIKAGMADAKDEAPLAGKPKKEKPKAVKEAKPPEQSAAVAEKPETELKPEEKLKAETPKEAAPKPEAKKPEEKKPEEKPAKPVKQAQSRPKKPTPPATAKKRDFNTDRIAALLNKIPDAANEPNPVVPSDEAPSKKFPTHDMHCDATEESA